MSKPVITVPHRVVPGEGPIWIFAHHALPFIAAMDYVYPELVRGSEERHTKQYYAAFRMDGKFIGSMLTRQVGKEFCIASPRKNPWFADDMDWMMRAFLAASAHIGSNFYSARTRVHNYGMQRMFWRLGLGGRLAFGGRNVVSCEGSPEARGELQALIQAAQGPYGEVRRAAAVRMARLQPEALLPVMAGLGEPVWRGDVVLTK
jgi:hypothetical protein